MGLKGITVNTAAEAEAHIYAEDDAAIYQSILGMDAVADLGQQCKATVISNNKIRVSDGVVVMQPGSLMENMKIVRSRTDRPERTEMI